MELLETVKKLWRERKSDLSEQGKRIAEHIAEPKRDSAEAALTPALLSTAAMRAGVGYSEKHGAFGAAPLFPMPHKLLFLLRTGEKKQMEKVRGVLTQMARGGIFDHLGGGFSRYSTDNKWLVPHFEKMLYDNALLAYTYAEAVHVLKEPFFASVCARTIDYALRELRDPAGGFHCAQDADSEGEEGRFYVFTLKEVESVLGADAAAFCARYDITPAGNFEGASIPNLLRDPDWRNAAEDFFTERTMLYRYRKSRYPLHKDDKVLTSWNALMIAALSRAGALLGREDYLKAADEAIAFLKNTMTAPGGGLYARYRGGEAGLDGTLDDYAFLCWALLEHYRARLDLNSLLEAKRIARLTHETFRDAEHGGYFMTASHALIARPKETFDGAIPSGNGVFAYALARLSAYSGEPEWQSMLDDLLRFLSADLARQPDAHCFALCALQVVLSPRTKIVAACADCAAAREIFRNSRADIHPIVLSPDTLGAMLAFDPALADYPLPETGIKWYLCENGTCSAPTDDVPDALL